MNEWMNDNFDFSQLHQTKTSHFTTKQLNKNNTHFTQHDVWLKRELAEIQGLCMSTQNNQRK